jgi:hypothetical protein
MSSNYFSLLLRGNWEKQQNWSLSDFSVSETEIENVDFKSMKTGIEQNLNRSVQMPDGTYRVDGILNVDVCNQVYLPRVRSIAWQMQYSLIYGAAGSIGLGVARRWTNLPGRFPYFFLIAQILFGIGTVLSALRLYQTRHHLGEVQKALKESVKQILSERSNVYANLQQLGSKCQEMKARCLHPGECQPLYRQWFAQWSKELLGEKPQTELERKQWLEKFFKEDAPLHKTRAEHLFNRSVASRHLPRHWDFLWEYQLYKERLAKPVDVTMQSLTSFSYGFAMSKAYCETKERLGQRYPQIAQAFDRSIQGKSDEEKRAFEEYRDLAYTAAANSPEVANFYKKEKENIRLWRNLSEVPYLKARQFLEKVGQFLEGELEQSPKIGYGVDDVIVVPKVPQLPEVPSPLDQTFRLRALELIPSQGSQEEYRQFCSTIDF